MQQTITIKCKLKLQSSLDESVLTKSLEQYRRACNAVSQYMFDHSFEMAQAKLNKALYRQLRNDYGLKAQMAQSAIRNVVAHYRTVKTQLAQKPYRYNTDKIDMATIFGKTRPVPWIGYGILSISNVLNWTCNAIVIGRLRTITLCLSIQLTGV